MCTATTGDGYICECPAGYPQTRVHLDHATSKLRIALRHKCEASVSPTAAPTEAPTSAPTDAPTSGPTSVPSDAPSASPTRSPTDAPTDAPTETPTDAPTETPTDAPTPAPTPAPTRAAVRAITGTFVIKGFEANTFDESAEIAFEKALREYLGDAAPEYSRIDISKEAHAATDHVSVRYRVTATSGSEAAHIKHKLTNSTMLQLQQQFANELRGIVHFVPPSMAVTTGEDAVVKVIEPSGATIAPTNAPTDSPDDGTDTGIAPDDSNSDSGGDDAVLRGLLWGSLALSLALVGAVLYVRNVSATAGGNSNDSGYPPFLHPHHPATNKSGERRAKAQKLPRGLGGGNVFGDR